MNTYDSVEWISAHIHFRERATDRWDRVLLGPVSSLLRELQATDRIRQFFFVRYDDSGPHVRLRLRPSGNTEAHSLQDRLEERVADWSLQQVLEDQLEVRWVRYEPEVDRYGGLEGMQAAEAFFHMSSAICLQILRSSAVLPIRMEKRLAWSLFALTAMAIVSSGDPRSASSLLNYYGTSYLRMHAGATRFDILRTQIDKQYESQSASLSAYVDELCERLASGESLGEHLDQYRTAAMECTSTYQRILASGQIRIGEHRVATWSECVRRIFTSLMHMHSNRLGVSISDESYLAILAHRAIDAVRA